MEEAERAMLLSALDESNWDLEKAAEALGITVRSMSYSVKKHNLARDRRAPAALHGK